MKRSEFNTRPCGKCGHLLIDVRDAFTGATFPVEADYVSYPGLVLTPAEDTRKNPFAHRAEVYVPHLPRCSGPVGEEEEIGPQDEDRHLPDLEEAQGPQDEDPAPEEAS